MERQRTKTPGRSAKAGGFKRIDRIASSPARKTGRIAEAIANANKFFTDVKKSVQPSAEEGVQ
jgi:hypothetical protein